MTKNVAKPMTELNWHTQVQNLLKILGKELGYDSYVEYQIGSRRVDNYWKNQHEKIALEIVNSKIMEKKTLQELRQTVDKVIVIHRASIEGKIDEDHSMFLDVLKLYKLGFSIAEISRKTGTNRGTIFAWVKGGTSPRAMNKEYADHQRDSILGIQSTPCPSGGGDNP